MQSVCKDISDIDTYFLYALVLLLSVPFLCVVVLARVGLDDTIGVFATLETVLGSLKALQNMCYYFL